MRIRLNSVKKLLLPILGVSFLAAAVPLANFRAPLTTSHATVSRYLVQGNFRDFQESRSFTAWLGQNGFDVAGVNLQSRQVEVITGDEGIRFLESHGIHGQAIQKKGPGLMRSQAAIDPQFLNPERLTQKLQAMAQANPQFTRLEQIGRSLEGRPIWGLLISTTPKANDPAALEKPSIIFDGMHHAREIMTTEIVVDVADTMLASLQARNPHAELIMRDWNIWVVPMLNVDGNNIVWTQDNWWRKNARADGGSTHGVDLNRNYPYRWGGCNGSSGSKGNQTYRGSSAASEPETQALMHLAEVVLPTASLSYHSYGELVLTPFGCSGELSSENAMIERIGKELAAKLPSDSGRGNYTPGAPWQILYGVDGDSMDHLFGAYGALAYTFEVNQDFQPSYRLREPTVRKHRVAWQYFMDRMENNLLGIKVIDGKTGQVAPAMIGVSGTRTGKSEAPFRTNSVGNFFKVLDPGTYVVGAKLRDGRSTELKVQMNGHKQLITVNVP